MHFSVSSLLILGCALIGVQSSPVCVIQEDTKSAFVDYFNGTCPLNVMSCSAEQNVDKCCSPANGLLVMAQQWMRSTGPSDSFTMHGLWPDHCDGSYTPNKGCDKSRNYNDIADTILNGNKTLYESMKTYWGSNKGDDDWFWSHEWSKHGTCVTTFDPKCYKPDEYTPRREVVDYFNEAIQLHFRMDLYKALAARGIVPTNDHPYTVQQFKDAIKSELGIDVSLKCQSGKELQEIWSWYLVRDKNQYVPTNAWKKDTCNQVWYRPKVSA